MAAGTRTRQFTFDKADTCFKKWLFTLKDTGRGPVVTGLEVVHSRRPSGRKRGCKGHPRTILALIKGRPVRSVDLDALRDTPCGRPISCGDALAMCLKKIKPKS